MARGTISNAMRKAANAPLLDAEQEQAILERVQAGDSPEALSQLVRAHLRLVIATASRHGGWGVSMDDLVSEGVVGLCEAARRFDPERGNRFSTYAAWWVRAYVRSYSLKNRRVVAMPATRAARVVLGRAAGTTRRLTGELGRPPTDAELAEALGVEVGDVELVRGALGNPDVTLSPIPGRAPLRLESSGPTPEDEVVRRDHDAKVRESVQLALESLDEREREIVRRRYLDGDAQTLRAVGEEMGLSRERVRQLEVRAKEKMRRVIAAA